MIKVKICGITNLEDALASLFNGADAIGFVFYKNSPRCIEPLKARKISRILPKNILRVGVFVNAQEKWVKRVAKFCNLDILQFHGNETCGYCDKFKGYKVVKAFKVGKKIDLAGIKKYKTYGYLFDTFSKTQAGGTGKKFNWNLLKNIDKINGRVFLSGGLDNRNVKSALKKLHPDWVDVSSSVESRPGKKDHKKLRRFIEALK
ncbi:MAG: phosphoribosylanthranilate isomerase [Candidatus Omnitrophota bacterium]|jgi:phosphoribosylanthranilate isomerase